MKQTRKILCLFLTLLMLISLLPAAALADGEPQPADDITVYVSISDSGSFVKDKEGKDVACVPVTVSDRNSDGVLDVDEALYAAHELLYDGGAAAGYASYTGDYGLSLGKLWGDESQCYGYWVNDVSCFSLADEVKSGDRLTAFIYADKSGWSDAYACFDKTFAEVYAGVPLELTLSAAGYDEDWNTVFSSCADAFIKINGAVQAKLTGADGKATLRFDAPGTYTVSAVKLNESDKPVITAPVCIVTVKALPNASITVPGGTEVKIERKDFTGYNYKKFTAISDSEIVVIKDSDSGTAAYYITSPVNNKEYYYRVSGTDCVTYAGYIKYTTASGFALNITENMLKPSGKTAKTVDRDLNSNSGHNVADLYLNINPQGYLKLDAIGDTFQLVNLRNWQAVNNTINNVFVEPDYHYTVIDESGAADSSVIAVSDTGLITAVGEGTAIVLVTYDAMSYAQGEGDTFFGAIWPENTGVFVVSVGAEDSGITTGMTINAGENTAYGKLAGDALDAEMDVIYFTGDEGSYTFTPGTDGCAVSVAKPTVGTAMTFSGFASVAENDDGSFTVPLAEGRNIVKLEKAGKAEYQVITAKQFSYVVNKGDEVHPGDSLSVVFDTIYNPATKIAGVYNGFSGIIYRTPDDKLVGSIAGGMAGIYDIASNPVYQTVEKYVTNTGSSYTKGESIVIPADFEGDVYVLSSGKIAAMQNQWSCEFGKHREITKTSGQPGPTTANKVRDAVFGYLPDIEIPITIPDAELESISAVLSDTAPKAFYEGYELDAADFTVTALYDSGATQTASNFIFTPLILTKDTEEITVSYRGKTASVPVSVTELKAVSIAVSAEPEKMNYTEGDVFNPSGMKVSVTYNSGKTAETVNYTYAPTLLSSEDNGNPVTVTYTGTDAQNGDTLTAHSSGTLSVSPRSGGGASETITVYFTLLGDDAHDSDRDGNVHTLKANNLTVWIAKTPVTVERGAKVIDVAAKALGKAGIPYSNPDGNYIKSIRGLEEFTNGDYSGWMYTLNGRYPSLGVSEQTLKNGDVIVFHYTDNYMLEDYGENPGEGSGGLPAATAPAIAASAAFSDIAPDDYYYDAVLWAFDNKVTSGTDETHFSPTAGCTRAEYVTFLYRASGSPEPKNAANPFEDVDPNAYYSKAVLWAVENGITDGTDKTHFLPNGAVTRAQAVTFLWRLCGKPEIAAANPFSDAHSSDYFGSAVLWAFENGVTDGTDKTHFSPYSGCTRAQCVTFLYRHFA